MERNDSLEKTLMLGKIKDGRRGRQRMSWLDAIADLMDMSWVSFRSWWWTGKPGVLQSMGLQRVWASNDNTAQKLVLNLPQELSAQKLCPYWRRTASEKYHPPLLTQPLPLSWVSSACILHKCIPIQGWKNKVSVLHFIHAVSFHLPK